MVRERKFSDEDLFLATKELLLDYGYEGFTFGLLAERLGVSRSALYKYFGNKEELIMEFMMYELDQFMDKLRKINDYNRFEDQFDYLLELLMNHPQIHQLIEIGRHVPVNNQKLKEKNDKLDGLHLDMYQSLVGFVQQGKGEGKLKPHIPDTLIVGYILQSFLVPNFAQIPHSEWVQSIKEIIRNGMFTDDH
ncbi:TetR family transcriptional regulator [Melghiribacillus thermohalophilus]|uniref:TetR family transcriptional regulator n=1 Tax=Melghiribacillus thermohalophilus TaxID=1324956 RepID=A0A4R3MSU1_9BACI|nr:TetR/AcrR family transcriptional regulator [Melghiribacillus thermohalophilus]TCT19344.1 TetR family transcriptional regulator [Melghiribacillus thermohalophilus]